MPEVHKARDALADLEERIIQGEKLDPLVLAAAEATVRLAEKEGEVAERARRRAREQALETAAAEGEQWLAAEAPPLAAQVVEAMAAAEVANRALVAALGGYQAGVDRAVAKIGRLRQAPTDVPHGRGLVAKVLAEVTAVAPGRRSQPGTPISEQFRRVAR
jgi:hypothetical protein